MLKYLYIWGGITKIEHFFVSKIFARLFCYNHEDPLNRGLGLLGAVSKTCSMVAHHFVNIFQYIYIYIYFFIELSMLLFGKENRISFSLQLCKWIFCRGSANIAFCNINKKWNRYIPFKSHHTHPIPINSFWYLISLWKNSE